jgi:ABC-type transport system involved in cytochrome bd biosynthesis fused ATPase/permease subunit
VRRDVGYASRMAAPSPVRRSEVAGALLRGCAGSLATVAAVVFVQRLALPLSVLWYGEQGYVTATAALLVAAALSFVRARAADRLARAARLNLLELYLAPFERGPVTSLPSADTVTARLATAIPTLIGWAVEGVATAIGAAFAVPAVALLLASTLGPLVLVPLGAAGLAGAVVTLLASRAVDRAWTAAWERSRSLLTTAAAGWDGALDLRAHGRAHVFADRVRGEALGWSRAEGKARIISAVATWGALGATLAAAAGTAALLGGRYAPTRAPGASGEAYLAFLLVLAAIPTLQALSGAVATLAASREELVSAAHQLAIATAATSAEADEPIDATAEIRLENVGYTYPPSEGEAHGNEALRDVTLVLQPGESVALVGPNGAGKTTLLHVVLGVVRPDRGRILVGGREARLDNRRFRARVAFLSQRPFALDGASIAENLRAFDPALPDARLITALGTVGLWPLLRARVATDRAALALPHAELSSGQARRIMLARALLRDADLLVLDEPEAHLDAASVDELAAVLRAVARERRILAVVHDRALARFADRIVELAAPPATTDLRP